MKKVFFALITFCTTHSLCTAGTAYEAMRVLGTQRGEASLHNVIEVRGMLTGPLATQKTTRWIILANEEGKGLREYQVINDKIATERVIRDGRASAPIDLNKLNLDSDGAQTLVDRESKAGGYTYDLADYILRGNSGGAPLWEINLTDTQSATVNSLVISADTGILLKGIDPGAPNIAGPVDGLPPVVTDGDPDERVSNEEDDEEDEREEVDREGNKVTRFFKRVGRHLERRRNQIDEKLQDTFNSGGNEAPTKRPSNQPPGRPAERPRD